MKAYNIMMFVLIFNLFLWIVTSIGIYTLGFEGGLQLDESKIDTSMDEAEQMEQRQNLLLWQLAGTTLWMVVGTIMAGAIIGGIFKVQDSYQAIVYGAITSIFWVSYYQSMRIFWGISSAVPGGIIILILITAVIVYIFLVGLFQMITGGWKGYV